jgi:glutaredoxin
MTDITLSAINSHESFKII